MEQRNNGKNHKGKILLTPSRIEPATRAREVEGITMFYLVDQHTSSFGLTLDFQPNKNNYEGHTY